jgi:hypothetical protein
MKENTFKMSLLIISAVISLTSCKKDKVGEGNDEEVITTMNLKFTPVNGGTTIIFSFDDPDGPGGNAPAQNTISLTHGVAYNVEVELLNKTANPVDNITSEVAAESGAHRFYYEATVTGLVTFTNLNNDINGMPLGLTSVWTAGAAGTGTTKVTLRHYPGTPPNKETADLVSSTKSATDIEVIFNTTIQ